MSIGSGGGQHHLRLRRHAPLSARSRSDRERPEPIADRAESRHAITKAPHMLLRDFQQADLPALIDLTIEAIRPLFETDLLQLLDPKVYAHDHGSWRDDYRSQVPSLHDPDAGRFITVAEEAGGSGRLLG